MDENISSFVEKYPEEIRDKFYELYTILMEAAEQTVEERLWARLPSYYVGENFVRFIPFKDHINIEAKAIMDYKEELSGFKFTAKGMLQLYLNQDIPADTLKKVFKETLAKDIATI